jgi:CO/xanthine dehydrogenase FAD-binding subunit
MAYGFGDLHWSKEIPVEKYLVPRTVSEALEMLDKHQGRAQVVAGGTDVIPQMRHRDLGVDVLVDITRLPGMNSIELTGDGIMVGGLVTHAQVASSPLIREKAPIFADGAGCVGSPQIRQMATVAGNLVTGHPAGDACIPLLALKATVTITSISGERVVPLAEFFLDRGKTRLDCRREILTKIMVPVLKESEGSSHVRLGKRKSLTIAVLVLALVVDVDRRENRIREAVMALGPVAPVPFRAHETEAMLRNAPIHRDTIERSGECAFRECHPLSSAVWGSEEYKREMVRVFTKRALRSALEQAGVPAL